MRKFAIIALALLLALPLSAQRTSNRQFFVEAGSGYPYMGHVGVGQYQLNGYWEASVGAVYHSVLLSSGIRLPFSPVTARGNYMWRMVSTRSRCVNLYGGCGLQMGCELIDPFHELPGSVDLGLDRKQSFIIGPSADLALELFPLRQVGMVLGGRIPFLFLSQVATKLSGKTIFCDIEGVVSIRVNL